VCLLFGGYDIAKRVGGVARRHIEDDVVLVQRRWGLMMILWWAIERGEMR
jgi:hypothetical protein